MLFFFFFHFFFPCKEILSPTTAAPAGAETFGSRVGLCLCAGETYAHVTAPTPSMRCVTEIVGFHFPRITVRDVSRLRSHLRQLSPTSLRFPGHLAFTCLPKRDLIALLRFRHLTRLPGRTPQACGAASLSQCDLIRPRMPLHAHPNVSQYNHVTTHYRFAVLLFTRSSSGQTFPLIFVLCSLPQLPPLLFFF